MNVKDPGSSPPTEFVEDDRAGDHPDHNELAAPSAPSGGHAQEHGRLSYQLQE
jgi:hypothetical protein